MLQSLFNLLFSYKPIPIQKRQCGAEHFIRLYGGGIIHDAWLCKDPANCIKN
jgi:hypothetical protein